MTQEEKELLIRDLSARLPYHLLGRDVFGKTREMKVVYPTGTIIAQEIDGENCSSCGFIPYLRPMSSMTEEEREEYCALQDKFLQSSQYPVTDAYEIFDWLNKNMFDYRSLIEKGLAIEAPKEMYKE